jgi:uncharacterized protein (TIGR02646 family)
MRRAYKNRYTKPAILELANCRVKIDEAVKDKNTHKFSTSYYGHSSVKTVLNKIYNSKCAFCESDTTAGASLQVEHYRPKARLSGEPTHKGYYWLGYEWTNLLLACAKCNRKKWDEFPIAPTGTRCIEYTKDAAGNTDYSTFIISYPKLSDEKALLINPELLNPADYLYFLPSGKINSKGNNSEADKTIETCNLNRRELRLKRKRMRDNLLLKYMKYFDDFNKGGPPHTMKDLKYIIIDKLVDIQDIYVKNEPYSMFARQILIHFEYFIANRFQPKEKAILMDAYLQFKNLNSKIINGL